MENGADYRITSIARLRALYGEPNPMTPRKLLTALDDTAIDFIARSPFLVLGTADAAGNQDVSPKGDAPGFVAVEDRHTLLIPDRRGNKLLFTFQNILANPHVAMIFMVPGTEETLRVNGTAELSAEPALLERLAARGVPAQLVIRVAVGECFFHCAKAFLRARLWEPQSWGERINFSWGRYLAAKAGASAETAHKIDQAVERDYKSNL
ncbi:MAG TPA: MSMEG_1061 family FMN-dependent PPOX-type flavoprotein [Candidatus Binataceae bacterium]|nr:MSMEG_1061 family FMN-dependent PPOX-type flavoprotein [Candidatus Binataceae bacterium]